MSLVEPTKTVYLIGSMRNPKIPRIGIELRNYGYDVFDDWYAPGKDADDCWQDYARERGQTYKEALFDYHARHVFEFDKYHLDRADAAVLAMPAGRSGHIELGYMVGRGKPTFVLFDEEPDRFDIMYQFATGIVFNLEELRVLLGNTLGVIHP